MGERDHTYYRTLYDLVRVINSSLEPTTVLDTIAKQVADAMNAKACTLRLIDRRGTTLLASAAWGLSKGYLRKGPIEIAKSGLDREVLAGNVVHIQDVATDPRFQYPEAARAEGLVSILVLPLLVEGKAIGSLRVYSDTRRDFTEEEVEFAGAIANLSAIAIENARMHQALKTDYELLTAYNNTIHEL
jgi:GAF domain-containing protein